MPPAAIDLSYVGVRHGVVIMHVPLGEAEGLVDLSWSANLAAEV